VDSADRDRKSAWKQEQRRQARAAFPLPDSDLTELFEAVAEKLRVQGCDETRRFTEGWARERGRPLEALGAWLDENGGFCDCEVLANVAPHWEENRLRAPDA